MLSAAEAEAEPNLEVVIKIYGQQQIDSLLGDIVAGTQTMQALIAEPTMQTPIDASTGTGGDGPSVPSPTPTPPVPPTPPYQSQVP